MSKFLSSEPKDQGKIYQLFFGIYDCRKKKTLTEAIVLYLGNLFSTGALAYVIGLIADKIFGITAGSMYANIRLWFLMPALIVIGFSLDVLRQRKLLKNSFYIGLALASGLLAYRFGGLVGLLVTSYLSTRGNEEEVGS